MTVQAITNPDRLLPEQSMTPYWVELRRRNDLLKAYIQLDSKIVALIRDFNVQVWRIPRGINKCPCRWERVDHDNITEAFDEFEDTVYQALSDFEEVAINVLTELSSLFGYDDDEVEQIRTADRELSRRAIIRNAFEVDLNRLINPASAQDDDLPF